MKKHKLKQIESRTKELLVDWMKTLVSEEEAKILNTSNILSYIPKSNPYMRTDTGNRLTAYSPKWIRKQLKSMVKQDPSLDVTLVTLKTLNKIVETQRTLSNTEVY
jgi:hypothetical protein|tara:strand:- start:1613 stop:1930 length:318 start_codon:yes stop_codon:yes gene_type:complete